MSTSPSSAATRLSLLRRAADRDGRAWRELLDLYAPLVTHWCRQCGLDVHQTADRIQDVFAAVAANLQDYQPRNTNGSFRSWLWTITRNKIRDAARASQRQTPPQGGSSNLRNLATIADSAIPDDEPSSFEQLSELTRRGLEQVRGEFEFATWQAFWRTVVDQVPTDVAAKELGLTPTAVRQYRSRVMRRLRQQLGDQA